MKSLLCSLCTALWLTATPGHAEQTRPVHGERVLATRQISAHQQLVVLEGPFVPLSVVKELATPGTPAQRPLDESAAGFTSISIELQFDVGQPLILYSFSRILWTTREYDQFEVLDVALPPGGPVIQLVVPPYEVVMLRVPLYGPAEAESLHDWSHIAAVVAPRTVKGRIFLNADKKLATIEVWEIVDNQAIRTDYVQRENAWKFERVKEPAR